MIATTYNCMAIAVLAVITIALTVIVYYGRGDTFREKLAAAWWVSAGE